MRHNMEMWCYYAFSDFNIWHQTFYNKWTCSTGDGDQLPKAMEVLSDMKRLELRTNTITYSILLVASEKWVFTYDNYDHWFKICIFYQWALNFWALITCFVERMILKLASSFFLKPKKMVLPLASLCLNV